MRWDITFLAGWTVASPDHTNEFYGLRTLLPMYICYEYITSSSQKRYKLASSGATTSSPAEAAEAEVWPEGAASSSSQVGCAFASAHSSFLCRLSHRANTLGSTEHMDAHMPSLYRRQPPHTGTPSAHPECLEE